MPVPRAPVRRSRSENPEKSELSLRTVSKGPDLEEIVVVASKQLTFRCGESSITLTAAGKIILRGKYIVSRSSGVQRIKGGSVQIN